MGDGRSPALRARVATTAVEMAINCHHRISIKRDVFRCDDLGVKGRGQPGPGPGSIWLLVACCGNQSH